MASLIRKTEENNPEDYVASGKQNSISKKSYRPYHRKLQKMEHFADNDWIDYYANTDSEEDDFECGVVKRKWRAHDIECFDEYKEDQ